MKFLLCHMNERWCQYGVSLVVSQCQNSKIYLEDPECLNGVSGRFRIGYMEVFGTCMTGTNM